MKLSWDLPAQGLVPRVYEIERVLIEYDGPQVVTLNGPDGLYLGVASDEDTSSIRWIYAPISHTEFKALTEGASSILDSLLKPEVAIVDVGQDGRAMHEWTADSMKLDRAALPKRGALLPKTARTEYAAPAPEKPELRLDAVHARKVGFKVLSDVLSSYQRLWTSIAQARSPRVMNRGRWKQDLSERAELALVGAGAGSLVLNIEPADPAIYVEIAQTFEGLTKAGDDTSALASQLSQLGQRVKSRYAELLEKLGKYDLQLLSRRNGGSAFLAAHSAPRILAAMPQEVAGEPKELIASGYFVAFNTRNQTFEFYDVGEEESYNGTVHPEVLARNQAILVGQGSSYNIKIEVVTYILQTHQVAQSYTLRQIEGALPA